MTVTVTPVRVYTQVGTNRDLTLGTERVTRVKRVEFRVDGAPACALPYLDGERVIESATASWWTGSVSPGMSISVFARKVCEDGTLGAQEPERTYYGVSLAVAWLVPVIAEHTPEWAR